MRIRAFVIAVGLIVGNMGATAAAQDIEGTTYWSAPASTCAASRLAIQNDRYAIWYDYLAYYSTNVDEIVLFCAVQPNDGGDHPNRMYFTYLDSTGTSASAYVKAELIRLPKGSGGYTVQATANSNSSGTTSVNEIYGTLSSTLDFDAYHYYVRITMDRTSSSEDVRAYGVSLEYTP